MCQSRRLPYLGALDQLRCSGVLDCTIPQGQHIHKIFYIKNVMLKNPLDALLQFLLPRPLLT